MKYIKTKRLILRLAGKWFKNIYQDESGSGCQTLFPSLQTPEESAEYARTAQNALSTEALACLLWKGKAPERIYRFHRNSLARKQTVHWTLIFCRPSKSDGEKAGKKHWNQGFATEAARGVKFVERQTDIKSVCLYVSTQYSIDQYNGENRRRNPSKTWPSRIMDGHSLKRHVLFKNPTPKERRFKL